MDCSTINGTRSRTHLIRSTLQQNQRACLHNLHRLNALPRDSLSSSLLVSSCFRLNKTLDGTLLKEILCKLNYSAKAVSSGEDAIEYLKETPVDLLILDMIMDPGIDGYDCYKKITEIVPAQKAIIASGYAESGRVRETQKLGAGVFIKKPYTIEKIGIAVKEELSR